MSKEQKSNREKKKPKKDKSATAATSGTAYAQAAKAAKEIVQNPFALRRHRDRRNLDLGIARQTGDLDRGPGWRARP